MELSLVLLCLFFLLGSLDDLFLDIIHTVFRLRPRKVTMTEFLNWKKKEEAPIAVMIPAWQEYDVLEAMVNTNLKRIKYQNFHWFIGVYPNDEKTLTLAQKLESIHPDKITVVVNNLPGPTSKAQMLNRILSVMSEGINKVKADDGIPWIPRFVAIHDAEDVIHPYSFTAINAQDEELDFIQVPIFSLPVPTSSWVAGTYLDEFADIHLREIPVRQKLRMPIPSAGVGTFFSYRILDILGRRFGEWFDEGNLTEDYEISMRIARLGGKQTFMLLEDPMGELIATREYFPSEFGRSVRQKTRWTTGIALQTMMRWGTYGSALQNPSWKSLMARYGVWRDRKALWANPMVFVAWTALLVLFLLSLNDPGWMNSFGSGKLLSTLMSLNLVFFGIRLLQRSRFTTKIYGLQHGLLVFFRLLLGSVINAFAALRAIKQFVAAKADNKENKIEWDKTAHYFPTEEQLGNQYDQVIQ